MIINWDKPIEYHADGTRWVSARLVCSDVKQYQGTNDHLILYMSKTNRPYESVVSVDKKGQYYGIQKVRNAVTTKTMYSRVLKYTDKSEGTVYYEADTKLFESRKEATDAKVNSSWVLAGVTKIVVTEDE